MVLLLNNGFGIFVMGWGIAYEDALKRPSENQRFVLFHKQSKVTITLKFIDFQEDIEKKIRTDITDIEKKLASNKPADNSG